MIAAGRRFLIDQWWVAAMPGIAIFVVSLGFNLLGDGLRDALDPRIAMTSERDDGAAARGRGSPCPLPARRRHGRGGARRLVHARPRAARHRRRIRLRQVADRPRHPRPHRAPRRSHRPAPFAFDGSDLLAMPERERRTAARQPHDDGDAGSALFAEPGDDGRAARSSRRIRAHRAARARRSVPQRWPCSPSGPRSASPSASWGSIRTSSPAAWASA